MANIVKIGPENCHFFIKVTPLVTKTGTTESYNYARVVEVCFSSSAGFGIISGHLRLFWLSFGFVILNKKRHTAYWTKTMSDSLEAAKKAGEELRKLNEQLADLTKPNTNKLEVIKGGKDGEGKPKC